MSALRYAHNIIEVGDHSKERSYCFFVCWEFHVIQCLNLLWIWWNTVFRPAVAIDNWDCLYWILLALRVRLLLIHCSLSSSKYFAHPFSVNPMLKVTDLGPLTVSLHCFHGMLCHFTPSLPPLVEDLVPGADKRGHFRNSSGSWWCADLSGILSLWVFEFDGEYFSIFNIFLFLIPIFLLA